ncbi:MAG: hypothetical protein RLZZ165_1127, partial [Bacteroidota bacterium]
EIPPDEFIQKCCIEGGSPSGGFPNADRPKPKVDPQTGGSAVSHFRMHAVAKRLASDT